MSRSHEKSSLCIVDTCTLVYLNDIILAKCPLQEWLWREFDIKYSQAVLKELEQFRTQMSIRREWEAYNNSQEVTYDKHVR